jgi:hypothetical protein
MSDTDANIQAILTALLQPEAAKSKYTLATAAGLTPAEVEYVLYGRKDPDVLEAWRTARTQLKEERCRRRRCSTCKQTYDADQYPRDASDPCGIARRCNACNRTHAKLAYQQRRNG